MEQSTVLRGFAIAVLDRGFVYVGNVVVDDKWCVITDARNIRKWGPDKGLGYLAIYGPQPNTALDEVCTVRAPMHSVQHFIETEAEKWKLS